MYLKGFLNDMVLGSRLRVYCVHCAVCNMCLYSITGTVRTDKQTGGEITNNVLRSFNRPLAPSVTLRMVVETTNV